MQQAQSAINKIAINTVSPIYVTQPALPQLQEFIPYLEAIWASKILTNGGPFHQQLEKALCDYLGVQHLALFSNGQRILGSDNSYARLIQRHLIEQADFIPYRNRVLAERRMTWIGQ